MSKELHDLLTEMVKLYQERQCFLAVHAERLCALLPAAPAAPAPSPDWRELTRRLFVELWHCDRQMMSVKKYGKPVFQQGQTVRDVLADAKAALEASKGGAA
jgi:hypothetical protein